MNDYGKMKKVTLVELLKSRKISYAGNKDILVQRLLDSDIFHTFPSPQQGFARSEFLPENILKKMRTSDPRIVANKLRERIHKKNLLRTLERVDKMRQSRSRDLPDALARLKSGKCLGSCSLCYDTTLRTSLNYILGYHTKCSNRTCKDLNNCYTCREELQELEDAYIQQREQDTCADGSCGDLANCFKCEKHIKDAITLEDLPWGYRNLMHLRNMTGDTSQFRQIISGMRSVVHNGHLNKLLQQLQKHKPDASEWADIKQKLADGQCLDSTCPLCGPTTLTKSLMALPDNFNPKCGGFVDSSCGDIMACSRCRKTVQDLIDTLSRHDKGHCSSGSCNNTSDCYRCRSPREDASDCSSPNCPQKRASIPNKRPHVERYCHDENCGGVRTCGACALEQYAEKRKRAEEGCEHRERERREIQASNSTNILGRLPSEANSNLNTRNDELRRRRAKNIKTSLTESSDGTMTGTSRKRRFSNLDLHYTLPSDYSLAKRIRVEEDRERQERKQALSRHERPSWFGTPEDPLPDLWMGRPVLPETEINILKAMDSIPKYYLSHSEEAIVACAKTQQDKRFSTIIRRLEAELMSRDFWMQSLGYDASDGFGNIPAGDYRLKHAQSTLLQERGSSRVEHWVSTLPRF